MDKGVGALLFFDLWEEKPGSVVRGDGLGQLLPVGLHPIPKGDPGGCQRMTCAVVQTGVYVETAGGYAYSFERWKEYATGVLESGSRACAMLVPGSRQ